MKRTLILLLCLAMTGSLFACGKNPSNDTGTDAVSSEFTGESQVETQESELSEGVVPEESASNSGAFAEITESEETKPTESKPTESEETKSAESKPAENKPTETHSHTWDTIKVDATCTTDGYIRYVCKCGVINTEVKLTKRGHSWKSASCAKPKTCLSCGLTEGTSLPHSWNEANYNRPKTCSNCKATEGSALAAPKITSNETFPKNYYYYSRSFTVNSCQISFATGTLGTERYIKITMNTTRDSDSTPTVGKLALKVKIYDAQGALAQQDSIWSDELAVGENGIMEALIPIPKSSQSNAYSVSFEMSY